MKKVIYGSQLILMKQRKAKYRILKTPGLMECGIENKNPHLFPSAMMLECQRIYSTQDCLFI
jgi:hypothetical protein